MATKGSCDGDKVDSIYKPNLMAFLALSVLPVLHASHAFPALLFKNAISELFSYATTAVVKLIAKAFFFNTKV